MISRLVRLAVLSSVLAWIVDRWLADRRDAAPPDPIRSLAVIEAPVERVWQEIADVAGSLPEGTIVMHDRVAPEGRGPRRAAGATVEGGRTLRDG